MKTNFKFLFVAALVLGMSLSTSAQAPMKSANGNNVDTVTDAGTKVMTSGPIKGVGSNGVLNVTVLVTKISGTVAGKVSLEGSSDGVNWYPIYAATKTWTDSTFFNPANVTPAQAYRFKVFNFADVYVRASYTGTGTMAAKLASSYFYRKAD